ncbi:hypothetical protein SVIO_010120 [Streptomyces violaceusniger]|uniref:methylmalonate-semialdehyde dehydrogenase (CoA acylating) n=1 Tax=Streptomyces violaceusniger TaxID=68280 RepID=A0A4D4KX18_STRVO|nr:hypothetical protein SVIO_010120 [Streptomyces violaceusniger]
MAGPGPEGVPRGTKNHTVVLPDADLEFATNHITAGAYVSAGERCMAVSVAVAVGSAADGLVEVLERKAREMAAYQEELFGPVLAVIRVADSPIHGPEGIRFHTRPKVVTTRWPRPTQQVAAGFTFPTPS